MTARPATAVGVVVAVAPVAPVPSGATPAERRLAGHLAGRAAAGDAVGRALAAGGHPEPGPGCVRIDNDPHGRPLVTIADGSYPPVAVSISHTGAVAVAVAALAGGPGLGADDAGTGLGIDVEAVEDRSARFERLVLTDAERLLPPVPGDDRATWLTRLWSAKEAAAKAGGLGLQGRPKAFEVTERAGGTLRVAGRWVDTEVVPFAGAPHVVAIAPSGPKVVPWRS